MKADEIECPFCAEVIKAKAKKCRHCGEFLAAGLDQEAVLAEHAAKSQEPAAPQPAAEGPSAEAAPVAEAAPAAEATQAAETEPAESPLSEFYRKLEQMPDSPERAMAMESLRKLADKKEEEDDDETTVEDMVKGVVNAIPDVAEIAINTMINPASGLTTLVQKVAKRISESQQKKGSEEESQTAAAEGVQKAATEVLEAVVESATDTKEG